MAEGRARRLRALLLEALRGCGPATVDALAAFASWPALVVLWDAGWLGGARATVAQVRRRLRAIASAHVPVAALATGEPGAVVYVTTDVAGVRAPDGLLLSDDEGGGPVLVSLADVRWVGERRAARVRDRIAVLGFLDRPLDAAAPSPDPRRPPRRAVVRAGERPLVAALETRYTPR